MRYCMATIAAILMTISFYAHNQNGILIFGFLMIAVLLIGNEK